MRRLIFVGLAVALFLLPALPVQAQLNGSHTLGDFGVNSGTQPAPGFYGALFYLHYGTDTIKDADGNTVRLAQDSPSSLGVGAFAPMAWYVSKAKLLGANYGAMVVLPFANASLEAPAFALGSTVGTSFSDLLVRPIDLGWHTRHADVAAGFQLYAPTGRYEKGGERQHRQGNVDRTSRSWERPSTSTRRRPSASPPPPTGSSTAQKEDSDHQGRSDPHLGGRPGQVVPRRRAHHRRGLLRAMEGHQGSSSAQFELPGGGEFEMNCPQQAQGVRPRAGRDAAGRDQVEALRVGQHPLPLGDGRAREDAGRDACRHGDLPDSQREAEVTGRDCADSGLSLEPAQRRALMRPTPKAGTSST